MVCFFFNERATGGNEGVVVDGEDELEVQDDDVEV